VPLKSFNENPLLVGNATTTSTSILEVRGILTTHAVALDATHVTFNVPWAEAAGTNAVAPIAPLNSAATANRDENRCHFM
jgi:hypothetical protein